MQRAALGIAVVTIASLPFIGTLDYPFLHDDRWAIDRNPNVQGEVDIGRIFSTNSWGNQPEYPHMHYRPLSVLTIAATRAAFGPDPAPFRVENVLLHAGVCLLLYLIGLALVRSAWAAAVGAAWFAVHPVHCEAVMFVVNREELLAAGFGLVALLVAIRRGPGVGGWRGVPVISVSFALALLCKEGAVSLPVILAAAIWLLPGGGDTRARARATCTIAVATGAILAAFVLLRYLVLGRVLSDFIPWQDNPLVLADTGGRLVGAMAILWEAARLLVAPFALTVDYGHDVLGLPAEGVTATAALGCGSVLLAAGAFARAVRRAPVVAFGLAFAAAAWLPFSNLLFPNSIILAERNLYLASAGAALVLVGLADGLLEAAATRARALAGGIAVAALIALLAMLAFIAFDRARDFESGERLFASSLAARPGSTRLHDNLGLEHLNAGRRWDAEREFRRALAIDPTNAEAHNNLGTVFRDTSRPAEAVNEFVAALRHRPGMVQALSNLCLVLVAGERHEAAIPYCEAACRKGGPVEEALERMATDGSCHE